MEQKSGVFITFEGGEGAGKSTIVSLFSDFLSREGLAHLRTKEPGGSETIFGKKIRDLLLDTDSENILDKTEVLLFAADRAQHIHTIVSPALREGKIVLCDRYIDSSIVYQGIVRGVGGEVKKISEWATDGLYPDLTFLLDIDPRIGLARRSDAGGENRIDKESISFHEQVREGFLTLASLSPDRFVVLDASQNKSSIFDIIVQVFRDKYPDLCSI